MKKCRYCKIDYVATKANKVYCSESCSKASRASQFRKNSKRQYDELASIRRLDILKCHSCGSDYIRHTGGYKYCSLACKNKELSKKRNSARRNNIYGIKKITRKFFLYIYDRDGGICNMCLKELDVGLRGLNQKDSPEIDHIVPVSRGGSHDENNIQLVCRSCNIKKGSKIIVEGRQHANT